MSRILLLIVALAGCGGTGSDQVAAQSGVQSAALSTGESVDCGLTIHFGSYAMGIDAGAFRAVEDLLANDPAVDSVERRGWGREGEVTLCARIRSDPDIERLFARIAAMLPPDPHGPIRIATRSGLTAQAPPR